jgi:hypothetical protein
MEVLQSMTRKNGNRFSETVVLRERDEIVIRFNPIGSGSSRCCLTNV